MTWLIGLYILGLVLCVVTLEVLCYKVNIVVKGLISLTWPLWWVLISTVVAIMLIAVGMVSLLSKISLIFRRRSE